jgi:hypothetical protein
MPFLHSQVNADGLGCATTLEQGTAAQKRTEKYVFLCGKWGSLRRMLPREPIQ